MLHKEANCITIDSTSALESLEVWRVQLNLSQLTTAADHNTNFHDNEHMNNQCRFTQRMGTVLHTEMPSNLYKTNPHTRIIQGPQLGV